MKYKILQYLVIPLITFWMFNPALAAEEESSLIPTLLIQSAEDGDVSDQFELGVIYDLGQLTLENKAEAAKWYRLAADQGHIEAQGRLCYLLYVNQIASLSEGEMLEQCHLAAQGGNASSQFLLATMSETGDRVPQSFIEAMKWHRLSAEQGNMYSQRALGIAYDRGEGAPQFAGLPSARLISAFNPISNFSEICADAN